MLCLLNIISLYRHLEGVRIAHTEGMSSDFQTSFAILLSSLWNNTQQLLLHMEVLPVTESKDNFRKKRITGISNTTGFSELTPNGRRQMFKGIARELRRPQIKLFE